LDTLAQKKLAAEKINEKALLDQLDLNTTTPKLLSKELPMFS
jgi:hypothetical protein